MRISDPTALINRIETEINTRLIALFIGTKDTAIWNATLDTRQIVENQSLSPSLPIISIDKGGVSIQNAEIPPDGAPLPAKFKESTDTPKQYNLSFAYYPDRSAQLFTRVTDDTKGERSFRYRIPAQVRASFDDDKKSYGGAYFSVAQLGTILSLPASRQSKSLTYNLGFVEATGGLKTFTLGTTGSLDADTIKSLSDSAGTLIDAQKAKNDPTAALTKQDNILKLQDDICTIQQKYNLPCTVKPQ